MAEWMITLRPNGELGTIYRVHAGNSRLHYYNNAFDYYTLNIKHPWRLKKLV
jgi:hypothetical protein